MSAGQISSHSSVILNALGANGRLLHPEVLRYVKGPGNGISIGEGIFDIAGSRFRWLNLLCRPIVGPYLLMTKYQTDVPFRVINRATVSPVLGGELRTERSFRFRGGTESFFDVLHAARSNPGALSNLLGQARRVELELRCEATSEGHLRLQSESAWLRLARLRLRLPRFLSVQVVVEDGYDDTSARQTIDTQVRSPIFGVVLEYRGSFVYRTESPTNSEC